MTKQNYVSLCSWSSSKPDFTP